MTSVRPPWLEHVVWPILILALLLSGARLAFDLRPLFVHIKDDGRMYDFQVMLHHLKSYEEKGVLYDTSGHQPFDPLTISMFKYPPPHAVVVQALVPAIEKVKGGPPGTTFYRRARPMLVASLLALAATLLLIVGVTRPSAKRAALMAIVALNWRPLLETLNGPQLEVLLLLLFALALAGLRSRRPWLGGVFLGVAGAIKVYPWFTGIFHGARRRFDVVAGMVAGGLLTLLVSGLFIPLRFTWEYFAHILPRLGGVSTSLENASVLVYIARLAHALTGSALTGTIGLGPSALKAGAVPPAAWAATLVLYASVVALLAVVTAKAFKQARLAGTPKGEAMIQAVFVCLLVLLIPSSWLNYQVLLILPLLIMVAWVPLRWPHRWVWGAILYAGAVGCMPTGSFSALVCGLRSLIPVALWGALLLEMKRLAGEPENGLRGSLHDTSGGVVALHE